MVGCPLGGFVFVAFEHADIVERLMTCRADKCRPIGTNWPVEPEPLHRERRRDAQPLYALAPRRAADPLGSPHDLLQTGHIGSQYHGVCIERTI